MSHWLPNSSSSSAPSWRPGRYSFISELINGALRVLEELDLASTVQVAELNRMLGQRLESLDRGERVAPAELREMLRMRSEDWRATRG